MGYTHYFTLKSKENVNLTNVQKDVQKVLDEHKNIIQFDDNNSKPLNDFTQGDLCIRFNGIGDDGHETFYFDTSNTNFAFCKTARKPYDIVVCKVLLILKNHFGNLIEVSISKFSIDLTS